MSFVNHITKRIQSLSHAYMLGSRLRSDLSIFKRNIDENLEDSKNSKIAALKNSEKGSFDFFTTTPNQKSHTTTNKTKKKAQDPLVRSLIEPTNPWIFTNFLPSTDDEIGGLSTINLDYEEPQHAIKVSGRINTERAQKMEFTPHISLNRIFSPKLRLDGYSGLRIIFKGDGLKYKINIECQPLDTISIPLSLYVKILFYKGIYFG